METPLIDPIEPKKFNLFAVDDFIRMSHAPSSRLALIQRHGQTRIAREKYEIENSLPSGAFEYAVMMADPRVQKIIAGLNARVELCRNDEDYKIILMDFNSALEGIYKLYPGAMNFIIAYHNIVRENQAKYGIPDIRPSLRKAQVANNTFLALNVNILVNINVQTSVITLVKLWVTAWVWVGGGNE